MSTSIYSNCTEDAAKARGSEIPTLCCRRKRHTAYSAVVPPATEAYHCGPERAGLAATYAARATLGTKNPLAGSVSLCVCAPAIQLPWGAYIMGPNPKQLTNQVHGSKA